MYNCLTKQASPTLIINFCFLKIYLPILSFTDCQRISAIMLPKIHPNCFHQSPTCSRTPTRVYKQRPNKTETNFVGLKSPNQDNDSCAVYSDPQKKRERQQQDSNLCGRTHVISSHTP